MTKYESFLSPRCPVCGQLPGLMISEYQVFCGNEGCRVLCWDMTMTKEDLLGSPTEISRPLNSHGPDEQ